jgi:hypothetical protein
LIVHIGATAGPPPTRTSHPVRQLEAQGNETVMGAEVFSGNHEVASQYFRDMKWSPTALACSAEVASATKAGQPWSLLYLRRNPPKHVLLRQGFEGHPLAFLHGLTAVASCVGG